MRFFTAAPDYDASGTTVTQLVLVCLDCETVIHHESHDVVDDRHDDPRAGPPPRPAEHPAIRGAR
jgi:hypothetical protein